MPQNKAGSSCHMAFLANCISLAKPRAGLILLLTVISLMANTESQSSEAATTTQVHAVVNCTSEQCLAAGRLSCHEHTIRPFKKWITEHIRSAFRQHNCETCTNNVQQYKYPVWFFLSFQQNQCYVSNYFFALCLIIFINKIAESGLLHG